MKILCQIVLLFLLAGCATPYYQVPVSSDGEYYIAERQGGGPYSVNNSILYVDYGIHPWWINSYAYELFPYYSPNFYPYYFYVGGPRQFPPYRGYYYHDCWRCFPHPHRNREGRTGDKIVTSPVVRPPSAVTYSSITELRKANDLALVPRIYDAPRSFPAQGRSSTSSTRSSSATRPSTRSSTRSSTKGVSRTKSGTRSVSHKN